MTGAGLGERAGGGQECSGRRRRLVPGPTHELCQLTSAPVWAGRGAGEPSGESGGKHSPVPTEACVGAYERWEEQG